MNNTEMTISVIMPALNEEAAIKDAVESALDALREYGVDGEIVVVNDGSTDSTKRIVSGLIKKHGNMVRVIDHESPMGIGRSFWDGVAASRGGAVVMMPGDNENYPGEIVKYAPLLEKADVVVPYVYNKEVRPLSRNILSALFRTLINLTFRTAFRYTNGTVLYKKSALSGIACASSGFFFQAELLVKCARKGRTITEVPYRLKAREGGESKAISLKSIRRVAADYLRLIRDVYSAKHERGSV